MVPFFKRSRPVSKSQSYSGKRLSIESLEAKNLLAGDVVASIIGGDLVLVGDAQDNSFRVQRDAGNLGTGNVKVTGTLGTTINGSASSTFSFTNDLRLDFVAGGTNRAFIGEPLLLFGSLELPGSVVIQGGAGNEGVSVSATTLAGDVELLDAAGGASAYIEITESTISGDVRQTSTAEYSSLSVGTRASIAGSVVQRATGAAAQESYLTLQDSTIGGDAEHRSTAATVSYTFVRGMEVGGDFGIYSSTGNDVVDMGTSLTTVGNTVGGDLRVHSGAGDDTHKIFDMAVGDDVVYRGGEGNDLWQFGAAGKSSSIGDDFYGSGGQGNDTILLESVAVGDKLRIGGGQGDDLASLADVTVGRSALVTLGDGINTASLTSVDAGRSLTVLGRGQNTIDLAGVTASHCITVITARGDDVVSVSDTSTYSMMIATKAGVDEVSIVDSAFDYLVVLLGAGDDSLTLDGVTVDRFALLSGGRGEDTLVDVGDASDINFELDFAFEDYGV
jgi:hypothetical protein